MSIEDAVLERLRELPAEKQQAVLDFAESVRQKAVPRQPRTSLKGLCGDLNLDVTEEEIAAARREMWANFPRNEP